MRIADRRIAVSRSPMANHDRKMPVVNVVTPK
jgi:hypothetical protein